MRVPLVIIMVLVCLQSTAQVDTFYLPGLTTSYKSAELLKQLNTQRENEKDRNEIKPLMTVSGAYNRRTDYVRTMVRDSSFLDNVEMSRLLSQTVRWIQGNNQGLTTTPKLFLVARNPFPNAACVGEGTFYITTGLLARITSQSQLAAVLSHEIAHYELNHMKEVMVMVDKAEQKAKQEAKRASKSGEISADVLLDLQKQFFEITARSRKSEREADSVGYAYFVQADFYQPDYITMLGLLDPEDSLRDGGPYGFLEPLITSRYPAKPYWFRRRASVYEKPASEFFMPMDKMRTHPELVQRVEDIAPRILDKGQADYGAGKLMEKCAWAAHIESASAAYRARYYDIALYMSLTGLRRQPKSTYLVTMTARILARLAQAKRDNELARFVPTSTAGYDIHMRQLNTMLNNLTREELAELGFHFLNKSGNFNSKVEEHYAVLWKLCDVSGRVETKKRVRDQYETRFPKGKYAREMK